MYFQYFYWTISSVTSHGPRTSILSKQCTNVQTKKEHRYLWSFVEIIWMSNTAKKVTYRKEMERQWLTDVDKQMDICLTKLLRLLHTTSNVVNWTREGRVTCIRVCPIPVNSVTLSGSYIAIVFLNATHLTLHWQIINSYAQHLYFTAYFCWFWTLEISDCVWHIIKNKQSGFFCCVPIAIPYTFSN